MTSNGNDEVNHSPSKKAQNNVSQIKKGSNSMLHGLGTPKKIRSNMGLKRARNSDPAGMCLAFLLIFLIQKKIRKKIKMKKV